VGIGAALVKSFIQHGIVVVGCARNMDKLQELSAELSKAGCFHPLASFHPMQCDISDDRQIVQMFNQIKEKHGGVDICINNAGMSTECPLLTGSPEDMKYMLMINVLGLSVCTQEAIKSMEARNVDGHIINLASTAGHKVSANEKFHFYAATKHMVRALTEGVRLELQSKKSDIRISEVSPGAVKTEFFTRMLSQERADEMFSAMECLTAEDVVSAVVYCLSAPPHMQVHDILFRPREQQN